MAQIPASEAPGRPGVEAIIRAEKIEKYYAQRARTVFRSSRRQI